jgi:predicted chitinase
VKTINYLYTGVPVIRVSREQLELLAMEAVCACWYYELAEVLELATDDDLIRIIEREPCKFCE